MNAQEVLIYAAMAQGLFLDEPALHELRLIVAKNVRRVTGNQDFVDSAPLDLIYVADHTRMKLVPAAQHQAHAFVTARAVAENVYPYCASAGLATVLRAWFDRDALAQAMGLGAATSCCRRKQWAASNSTSPHDFAHEVDHRLGVLLVDRQRSCSGT